MQDNTKLPYMLFMVKVPTVATYSEEEMMIYGLPTEYDKDDNIKDTFGDMSIVELNIDKIIDIYTMGYPISIVKQEDSKKLFTILEGYLEAQVHKVSSSINQVFVQDERVDEIDKFLTEMFDFNRNTIIGEQLTNTGGGFAMDMGMMNTGSLHTTPTIIQDGSVDYNQQTGATGIMAGYNTQPVQQPYQQRTMQPMVQQNQPIIDLSGVKRKSVVKLRSGITAGYMNDETFDI